MGLPRKERKGGYYCKAVSRPGEGGRGGGDEVGGDGGAYL